MLLDVQSESGRGVERYSRVIRGAVVCSSPETPEREPVDLARRRAAVGG